MKFLRVAACLILALPAASAAPAQTRPAATPALSHAAQLDLMADFFVPRTAIFAMGREMCDTAFRTALVGDPEMAKLQKTLPGLIDRMVKAAASHCDIEMAKVLDRRQDQVRAYWSAQVSPADLGRLARTLAVSVEEARGLRIEVRPGDTMKDIVARIPPEPAAWDQRLRAGQIALARTPGGVALVNKVYAYQQSMTPLLQQDEQTLVSIGENAFKLAHREANLYAQERGLSELYADAPVPPLAPPPPGSAAALPAKLQGSFVYVYSFLDVREDEYTPKVLGQFDADLTARLAALHIPSKILRFNDSSRGKEESYAKKTGYGDSSRLVPVGETVARNFDDEHASGARFRLVIFPANFTTSGVWRSYDIRFQLMDSFLNKQVWEYVYSGKHMVMLKDSENAQARSKKILDHAFEELKAKGFL
jgi:hypothetical protein